MDFLFHKSFIYSFILICFFSSIICQFLLGVFFRKLLKEAKCMSTTKNRYLKKIKLKYSNYRDLHENINNTEAFIQKETRKVVYRNMPLVVWKYLSEQLTLMGVIFSGVGVCVIIARGEKIQSLIPLYLLAFLGIYFYLTFASIFDYEKMKNALIYHLVDYFDNSENSRKKRVKIDQEIIEPQKDEVKNKLKNVAKEYNIETDFHQNENNQDDNSRDYEMLGILKELLS